MKTHGEVDELYQLAADMGGAEYIFTGEHDADVMYNSALINLNVVHAAVQYKVRRVFYSSSACMYPAYNQEDPDNPNCTESSAYPAAPDSEYGWEKLFSERLYKAYERNYGLQVRIARFHNIYGIQGTYQGGREKVPAALCRKVAHAQDGTHIEVFGDGRQTRSFTYVDDCIDGILRLMDSECNVPVNIGSSELIAINDLAKMIIEISGKDLDIVNIEGPQGVRGRNSDNTFIQSQLNWQPTTLLRDGIPRLYEWVKGQVV